MSVVAGFYGTDYRATIGVQTDFDTENTAGDHVELPFESIRPEINRGSSTAALLGQGKHLPEKTHWDMYAPRATMTVPVEMTSLGYHLTAMFGVPTTTVGTPNQHAWILNEVAVDPYNYTLALEPKDRAGTAEVTRFGKAIYDSMSISLRRSTGPLRVDFGLLAARVANNVATHDATPTIPTLGAELRNHHGFVRLGADVATQTTTVGVTGCDFSINRNHAHDLEQLINSDVAGGFLPGVPVLSGTLSFRAQDYTLRDQAAAGVPIKMVIGTQIAGNPEHMLISSDLCLLDPFEFEAGGLGMLTASTGFRIQQPGVNPPGSGANALQIRLFNGSGNYSIVVPS